MLINQLGSLKKEEELYKKHHNHMHIYIYEIKHKQQQTINTNVIMEFNNLAYISGLLSQWVRLSYLYSNL
jgi:hypothetical protein